jgi:hypothetical protein
MRRTPRWVPFSRLEKLLILFALINSYNVDRESPETRIASGMRTHSGFKGYALLGLGGLGDAAGADLQGCGFMCFIKSHPSTCTLVLLRQQDTLQPWIFGGHNFGLG